MFEVNENDARVCQQFFDSLKTSFPTSSVKQFPYPSYFEFHLESETFSSVEFGQLREDISKCFPVKGCSCRIEKNPFSSSLAPSVIVTIPKQATYIRSYPILFHSVASLALAATSFGLWIYYAFSLSL